MNVTTMYLPDALMEEHARCMEILAWAIDNGRGEESLIESLSESLARADRAAVDGDVVLMLQAVEDLRGYSE